MMTGAAMPMPGANRTKARLITIIEEGCPITEIEEFPNGLRPPGSTQVDRPAPAGLIEVNAISVGRNILDIRQCRVSPEQ